MSRCFPYTYTRLQKYLKRLQLDPIRAKTFRRRALCHTLAGNVCDLLTVTSWTQRPEDLLTRKGVVLSARVHPGESNASFVMEGILDFLTGPSAQAKAGAEPKLDNL